MTQEKPWWDSDEWLGSLLGDDNVPFAIPGLVREAERRGREATFKTVDPLYMTLGDLSGTADTETVEIVAIPKSFFES